MAPAPEGVEDWTIRMTLTGTAAILHMRGNAGWQILRVADFETGQAAQDLLDRGQAPAGLDQAVLEQGDQAGGLHADLPDGLAGAVLQAGVALLAGVLRQRPLHVERSPNGTLGVVLVGDRSAKQTEDRVAPEMRDRPVIPLNGRRHLGDHPVDEIGPVLGIHRLGKLCRTDDVSKEGRN